jgi:hypothetical protein
VEDNPQPSSGLTPLTGGTAGSIPTLKSLRILSIPCTNLVVMHVLMALYQVQHHSRVQVVLSPNSLPFVGCSCQSVLVLAVQLQA